MEQHVLFENDFLFGNIILEAIPHPSNWIGEFLKYSSILCHVLGGDKFFIFLLPFVYLSYNRIFGIKLAIALLSSGIINGFAKYYFESVRPFGLSESILNSQGNFIKEASYGFPSGHTQISILIWGFLFLEFKNKYFRIFALYIIFFTPFSRLYTGMHFPGDVIGGFFIGLISLILLEYLFFKYPNFIHINFPEEKKKQYFRTITLVIIVLTLSSILLKSNGTIMSDSSISLIITCAGSISGSVIGFVFLEIFYPKVKDWERASNWKDFLKRSGIIFLLIGVFYFGINYLIKNLDFNETLARYIKYTLLNFNLVAIAPILYYQWKSK